MSIIQFQTRLDKEINNNIVGNFEYSEERNILEQMDLILRESGVEDIVIKEWLKAAESKKKQSKSKSNKLSEKCKISVQERAILALRCALLRKHLRGVSYRALAKTLALTPLYQWFCGISSWKKIRIPCKSKLQAYEDKLSEKTILKISKILISYSCLESGEHGSLKTKERIDTTECFFDTFCLKTNIHYPTDWVLLRDASRSLMLAVIQIRKNGIYNRLSSDCQKFITDMNKLCIKMTQSARVTNGRKIRKDCFRKMKKLVKRIKKHAEAHLRKLNKHWQKTDLTEKQMLQIKKKIENILEQLPEAIRQGHERIIGDRPVKNDVKILSLYEDGVNVIVRHKANAMVEYGNKVSLLEQRDGLIIDWDLAKEGSPADSNLCMESFNQTIRTYGEIKSLSADRGCSSFKNSEHLNNHNTFDATCPRSIIELSERMKDKKFRELQKRRASTEARISILSNFTGEKLKCKSYSHRRRQFGLCVLTHNLWKLAKMAIAGKRYWEEYEKAS